MFIHLKEHSDRICLRNKRKCFKIVFKSCDPRETDSCDTFFITVHTTVWLKKGVGYRITAQGELLKIRYVAIRVLLVNSHV